MCKLTVTSKVHLGIGHRSRNEVRTGPAPNAPAATRVTRVARLVALAIRFEQLVRDGTVPDYAELARLGHVTRAQMSQIMNLLNLTLDIQEALLFLPEMVEGKDVVTERRVRKFVANCR